MMLYFKTDYSDSIVPVLSTVTERSYSSVPGITFEVYHTGDSDEEGPGPSSSKMVTPGSGTKDESSYWLVLLEK